MKNQLIDWIVNHWPAITGGALTGGGSGYLGKLMVDKKQNEKIQSLSDDSLLVKKRLDMITAKIKSMEENQIKVTEALNMLESNLRINTELDKQLRIEIKDNRRAFEKRLDDITQMLQLLIQKSL